MNRVFLNIRCVNRVEFDSGIAIEVPFDGYDADEDKREIRLFIKKDYLFPGFKMHEDDLSDFGRKVLGVSE